MVRRAPGVRAGGALRLLGYRVRRWAAPDVKLAPDDVVDLDMCWAYDLADPWGNIYELNCYEYDRVQVDLIDADGISPRRHWPKELYTASQG